MSGGEWLSKEEDLMEPRKIIPIDQASGVIPLEGRPPITVIGTQEIRDGFEQGCLDQAVNAATSPGIIKTILNADAHLGRGAPIGCVMVSPTHIYPGPVGVDVKCSMSLLQLDLPVAEIRDKMVRRTLINAICDRIPTGAGNRSVPKGVCYCQNQTRRNVVEGASEKICKELEIPDEWRARCEDSVHLDHAGHGVSDLDFSLWDRAGKVIHDEPRLEQKLSQFGSLGGGNHFCEAEAVEIVNPDADQSVVETFGLKQGCVAMLTHCGSRGWGNLLATNQFKTLQKHFELWSIPLPGGDKELVYAPLGTPEADDYLDDMALAANFATVNHLLINKLILQAYQETFPGVKGNLVYFISHNIARQEVVGGRLCWVHRKGATRAFPRGHFALKGTPFDGTGHPILLPGNPVAGSLVMVALPGAEQSCYSVNHGAGRAMGRKAADRTLDQKTVDAEFDTADILTNCRQYPKDEAPAAYKNFVEVIKSVEQAGLARPVARLRARFVIKDGDKADD